jgi:hypothetical protein
VNPEEIVRRLAKADPNHHSYMWHECVLCGEATPVGVEGHREDCVWRLAVELVADQAMRVEETP